MHSTCYLHQVIPLVASHEIGSIYTAEKVSLLTSRQILTRLLSVGWSRLPLPSLPTMMRPYVMFVSTPRPVCLPTLVAWV